MIKSKTKETYFVEEFRKFYREEVGAKTFNELGYLANQILEVGGCGEFNPADHPNFLAGNKKK